MQTGCSRDLFGFSRAGKRKVVASFDGGAVTSDAGGLLLVSRFGSFYPPSLASA